MNKRSNSHLNVLSVGPACTMVDGENFPTVHLDEAAERQLSVFDPQLLGRLEGDALQTVSRNRKFMERVRLHWRTASTPGYLVVVVVNQSSDHIGFIEVQLLELGGGVRGQINQLLLCHNVSKVLRFQMNVLQKKENPHSQSVQTSVQ